MSEAPVSVSEAETGLNRRAVGGWLLRPGRSLTRRLVWLASAWIALALIVTGAVLTYQFQESALRRLGNVLSETIDEAVIATTVMPDGSVLTTPIMDARTLRLLSGKYWAVAEPDGRGGLRTLIRSESLGSEGLAVPRGLAAQLAEAAGVIITYNAIGPNDEPLMVAASLKTLPGRTAPIVFLAGIDRSDIDADARQFATLAWLTLGLLGIGLLIAVFLQVRIGLRPLYDLRDEISNVRKGKAARIERTYPAEISPLAEQVNRLLDHNQDVVERQRTHVGNLAHALKTPLSVMLAEAGGDPSQLADIVRRQSDVMKGQVDHHLRRARAAARSQGLGERTPVPEVLDEMSVMLERVFQSKSVEIDWRAPDTLGFLGERQDLQEILGNLMENACKWCARKVRVSAGASGLGQMIVVVEDDGPGLAADRYDEVMKRGARADEDTPGSGLGLAIVDDLTRAYGGRLTLGPSDMGGLKAILTLPAAER